MIDINKNKIIFKVLPLALHKYILLFRLDRPIGFMLLFYPVSFGLSVSSKINSDFLFVISFFLLGSIIMRSAGCIINDLWDRNIDIQIERTQTRPIASGEISVLKALISLTILLFFGFLIALGVNSLPKVMKGPTIFISLLPMIVTPLIGSLILFWMIDAQGIIGSILQEIFDDPNLSLKASPLLTWIMLMVYGVWHSSPFAFIVFYAGLQTVPSDTIEAAMIDGASRWERTKYVVLPHLMPLTIFILLIQLMDNFRVFEPIVGFSAQANATSLSWIIYNDISNNEDQFFGSAGATSVLTIIGVSVLLIPVLIRTWREFNRKVV